jgi:hypothetical protein
MCSLPWCLPHHAPRINILEPLTSGSRGYFGHSYRKMFSNPLPSPVCDLVVFVSSLLFFPLRTQGPESDASTIPTEELGFIPAEWICEGNDNSQHFLGPCSMLGNCKCNPHTLCHHSGQCPGPITASTQAGPSLGKTLFFHVYAFVY